MSESKQPAAHTPAKDSDKWHGLKEHLDCVAQKARFYADKFGAGELGYYAGLWHDLGKYNPEFQRYLELCHIASKVGKKAPHPKIPHAVQGARLAWEKLQPLAPIIYGHHGGLPENSHMKSEIVKLQEEPAFDESYQEVLRQAPEGLCQLQTEINLRQLMSGFGIDLRQLRSGVEKDTYRYEFFTRILFSCLIDADHLDTEAHFSPEKAALRGANITIAQLWDLLQKTQNEVIDNAETTPVNQIRADVYRACVDAALLSPGVFRLAVPTGGGKTLSGLAFSLRHAIDHHLDRVIVAVPYTSIIDQTVGVYRDIFGQEAVLEHHSASKEPDDEDARQEMAQARLATQNWDAPLIVTTTVQLFESLFANRPSRCRKLHNIVGSVIILDEVQTLPLLLLKPILSVLQELVDRYRVTIVLCTATQPALEGQSRYLEGFAPGSVQDIIPPQQAREYFVSLSRVTYLIPEDPWNWERLAQDIQQQDQALVILNTRKDALAVLDRLGGAEHVFHLSTLLCGKHRQEVLQKIHDRLNPKNPQPCILVSTQVVEAGVDLDFPVVYRAIAPLDRIVQAAGRCNREGKRENKGRVVIFDPAEGSTPKGMYETAISITKDLLKSPDLDLDSPEIFEEYFHKLYENVNTDKCDIQGLRKKLNYPEVSKKFKFIQDDTTPVVIQHDDRVRGLLRLIERRGLLSGDWRSLQPYLVNLRNYEFSRTEDLRREIAPGLWVWQDGNYDHLVRGIMMGGKAIIFDPADLIV
ncbi:MAG: CRISPR-associated helicase Cas3' [Coleofasciculaceae cyanobacterium SM2_1_6]|nr:CRISPR-associated helicase Cas3' [Coleofasciculaceae cyanobacterium SM2_1_6]